MRQIPSGTVTFLFTDIEGSTRKWEAQRESMAAALARHDAILRGAIAARRGYTFKTVGDAFCAAFYDPLDGLLASVDVQRALESEPWRVEGGISVREALHAGSAEVRDEDYFGQTVNRVARLLSLAHGGQILCSLAAAELLADRLPSELSLRCLGRFRLKDLSRPETVAQVTGPGLREAFPALKSLDGMPNNLPLQSGTFIGREDELEAIRAALVDPAGREAPCRLLTLAGPGGSGKTRLALQAGAELLDRFPGGVWFVDLSACRGPVDTARAANRALGAREREGLDPEAALASFLERREILLVLDNLEQDLEAAPLIARLLSALPGLSILATSREALRLSWERVLPLRPLGLPPRDRPPDAASVSQYEAVRLFIERASSARRGFTVNARNAPAIAGICQRLEGIPLAIELAAARTRAFLPDEILARLEVGFDFLDDTRSDLPRRQRSLRAAAQWSYDLLGKTEKAAFRALGVFEASFGLETAEAFLGAALCAAGPKGGASAARRRDGAGPGAGRADSLLSSLLDKSLVVQEEPIGAAEDPGNGSTFRMLETLRAFAREKLEAAGEAEKASAVHAELYLRLAGAWRSETPPEALRLALLDAAYPDFAAAFERLLASGRGSEALRLAAGLGRYWEIRAMLEEGMDKLGRALEATAPRASPETGEAGAGAEAARARALGSLGVLQRLAGACEASLLSFRFSRELSSRAGDALGEADARLGSAWTLARLGRRAEAREEFQAAAAVFEGAGAAGRRALVDHGLALLAQAEGRFEESRALCRSALPALRAAGEVAAAAKAAGNLALAELRLGDRAAAMRGLEEASALFEELGDREAIMVAENNLACIAAEEGDHEAALGRYGALETLARSLGRGRFAALALAGGAECLLELGRPGEALLRSEESLGLSAGLGPSLERAACLRVSARVLAARGEREAALRALDEAEAMLERHGGEELEKARALRRAIVCGGESAR